MKKILVLILALVMVLSLTACSGNSASKQNEIIGAWNPKDAFDVFVFSADGKVVRGIYGSTQYDWWYDKDVERYFISMYGETYSFVIEEDENGRFINLGGAPLYYVENYDPEVMKAEKIASITEGKTELVVGDTYTSKSGVTFTLTKAEITYEENEGYLNAYFDSDGNMTLYDIIDSSNATYKWLNGENYAAFRYWYRDDEEDPINQNHICAGIGRTADKIESDKEQFGYLLLNIDNGEYYISIDSFS